MEGIRKTSENLDQDSRFKGRDSNPAPPKISPRGYRCIDCFVISIQYVCLNIEYFSKREKTAILYNEDEMCLLWGTEWVLKCFLHGLKTVQWMLTSISWYKFWNETNASYNSGNFSYTCVKGVVWINRCRGIFYLCSLQFNKFESFSCLQIIHVY
jgi:hypothetical protein